MTSVILSCKHNQAEGGIDFEIRFGQDENPTNEEKAAAVYFMPYMKQAFEVAIKEAEAKTKQQQEEAPKIAETLDGGPKIITLD
jgi:hypothetical protein